MSEEAKKNLIRILKKPLTRKQKEALKRSKGLYEYYKAKWTK